MKEKVEKVLDEIRPMLQTGCPMSTITLRMGIEKKLREAIPEMKSLEQVF